MAKFTEQDIRYAQEVQKKYGVPASVVLGQYAQESGYGKSTVGANNYFNIKGNGKGGYKDYNSKEESFFDFGRLLSTSRYTKYTKNATSTSSYMMGVKKAGYATDPNYVNRVLSIIKTNNLTSLDDTSQITAKGYTPEIYGKKPTGTVEVSPSTNSSKNSGNSIGLTWWGDIVKVILIILILIGAMVFFTVSIGGTMSTPLDKVKGVLK